MKPTLTLCFVAGKHVKSLSIEGDTDTSTSCLSQLFNPDVRNRHSDFATLNATCIVEYKIACPQTA